MRERRKLYGHIVITIDMDSIVREFFGRRTARDHADQPRIAITCVDQKPFNSFLPSLLHTGKFKPMWRFRSILAEDPFLGEMITIQQGK